MTLRFLLLLALLAVTTVVAQMTPAPQTPPSPLVTVQADVWADNWFALYVNGRLIREDSVPITTERSFNAERFTFQTPWPAQLSLVARDYRADDTGLEYIGTARQQLGDGGLIAQFRNAATGELLAVTDASARVFVTHQAPLDPACAAQAAPRASVAPCLFRAVAEPEGWAGADFSDAAWAPATVYTAAQVQPKDGYDEVSWDRAAALIWSGDLLRDNTVLVRLRPLGAGVAAAVSAAPAVALAVATSPASVTDPCSERVRRFEQAGAQARAHCEGGFLIVESSGLAQEPMMVGITAWQQQVPLPQPYQGSNAYRIPLTPAPAARPTPTSGVGAVAVALNGVPIFNPSKPSQGGDQSVYDPRNDPKLIGELDQCGGHSGRGDDYHYHAGPVCFLDRLGEKTGGVVGYALDGYSVLEFHDAGERLPTDLDACNGHTHDPLGYHYHLTEQAPYVLGCFHGDVTGAFQPQTLHVRPAGGPVRATITSFGLASDGWTRLGFTLGGAEQTLAYRPAPGSAGCYVFQYPTPAPPTSPGSGIQTHCPQPR